MNKYLKIFYGILMSFMIFSMTACGDEDDEPSNGNTPSSPSTVSGFVGTWIDESQDADHTEYFQFTKDGKINIVLIEEDGLVVSHAKWSVKNNVINISDFYYDRNLTTAPDPDGDFKDGDWIEGMVIESLTSDKLIVRILKDGVLSSRITIYKRVSDSLIDQYL